MWASKLGCSDVRTSEMCGHQIVDVIRAKRRTYKLRMTHISGGILPPSGCNSLPPEPNLDASCVHFPL